MAAAIPTGETTLAVAEVTVPACKKFRPTPAAAEPPCAKAQLLDDDDDDDDESVDSGADDEVGSLVDFVVEDCDDEDSEEDPTEKEYTGSQEEEGANELDGIDTSNIILGKRTRRQTQFYDREVFGSAEYRDLVLKDVPESERDAALGCEGEEDRSDDGGEEDEAEDSDASYVSEGGEEEEGSDEDEEAEECDVGEDPRPSDGKK